MGNTCSICKHSARQYIDLELVKGTSYRDIEAQFSGEISRSALGRHKKNHIPESLVKAQKAEEISKADRIVEELERIRRYANKVLEACDRELTDPDNPDQYYIGPRADDVDVTYVELDDEGKPHRHKARLSVLLRELVDNGMLPAAHRWKIADPRELILKAHKALRDDLEFLARLWGEIKDQTATTILVTDPVFVQLQAVILEATKDVPEVRQKIGYALSRFSNE